MATTVDDAGSGALRLDSDEHLFRKITRRLLPILTIGYLIAFLDRINIGYAELQMKEDLGLSEVAFALGASIFFVGYLIFEVPSNIFLERIGARATLMRIMIAWGLVAAGMAFVTNVTTFYIMRFLLGAFEAGFYPGVVLYLTYWFPPSRRGRAMAIFAMGTSFAYLIAGPLSGALLKYMNGAAGLAGWQWMFIVQGLPACIMGLVVWKFLSNRPSEAGWLSTDEKARVEEHLAREPHPVETGHHGSWRSMLADPKVYLLILVYFLALGATYSMLFWSPTLIKSWGVADPLVIGLLGMLPSTCAIIGIYLIGRSSDRHMERRWHYLASAVICAAGIFLTVFTKGLLVPSLIGLCIMAIGQGAVTPMFFTAVTEYLPAKTAALGVAVVSSLGNLGPAILPPVLEKVTVATESQSTSLFIIASLYVLSGLLLMVVIRGNPKAQQLAEAS